MKLYCCVGKLSIPDEIVQLDLLEMAAYSKVMQAKSQNLQFTVPASTETIYVALQNPSAGANPGFPPNKFTAANDSDLNLQSLQITYANQTKTQTRWVSGFAAGTNALTQLNEVGARLYQMQKEQFVRSEDEANRLSAKGFVQSFWKVIVVDQVADAKVKASWTSIVQDLIEINNSISEKRANFDANAETYPERGTGIKRERPQEKARKEIEEAFNRAEKTVKTASKVLMDLDDLKRELKELAKRDS